MTLEDLARLEQALRKMADELAALRSQIPMEQGPPSIPTLPAPSDLQELVNQAIKTLAERVGEKGAQVLIAGVCKVPPGRAYSWYEIFSEEEIKKVLQPQTFRAFEGMARVERLRLLQSLQEGFHRSAELMERSGLSQGQFYHHMRILEASGMVHKKGRDEYGITVHGVSSLFTIIAAASHVLSGLSHLFPQEEGEP